MANGNPTLESLSMRLGWLERERMKRLEDRAVDKNELLREQDARQAEDRALEKAIGELKEDIQVIKTNTTWALRTVAGTVLLLLGNIIVTIASGGGF